MYPIEKYDFKTYEKTNPDGTKSTVVIALTTYRGRVVKGVAKCMESDDFSLDKGKELAAARCDLKVNYKRMMRLNNKSNEALIDFYKAEKHLNKMKDSLNDSIDKYLKSSKRLESIEKIMK